MADSRQQYAAPYPAECVATNTRGIAQIAQRTEAWLWDGSQFFLCLGNTANNGDYYWRFNTAATSSSSTGFDGFVGGACNYASGYWQARGRSAMAVNGTWSYSDGDGCRDCGSVTNGADGYNYFAHTH